jgi:DNA-binding transcriptional MerR regulator
MERPPKLFSIQEVSQMLNVPKHTLRFWEKEFEDILLPLRTKGGQRRYTYQIISIIEEIKRLRTKNINLGEIRRIIRSYDYVVNQNSTRIDLLASKVADMVKNEVYNFIKKELYERQADNHIAPIVERGSSEVAESIDMKRTKQE